LRLVGDFAPTGIPVRVLSNRHDAADWLEDALGFWKDFPIGTGWKEASPLLVRLVCHDAGGAAPTEPIYRMPKDNLLLIGLGQNIALADREAGEATAYITPAILEDQPAFRYWLLQAILVFLLTPRDRIPLHAAAVVKDGQAVLLSGPSSVGKSTLALAATLGGYLVLADDAVYVQRRPEFRVWGLSPYVHLPPSALGVIPGAERMVVRGIPGRRGKVLLDLRKGGYWPWPPTALHVTLCSVVKSDNGTGLRPVSWGELTSRLLETLPTGFDLFREELERLLLAWPDKQGWELSLSSRPEDALPFIDRIFQQMPTS
jgi:hypothetical protein